MPVKQEEEYCAGASPEGLAAAQPGRLSPVFAPGWTKHEFVRHHQVGEEKIRECSEIINWKSRQS